MWKSMILLDQEHKTFAEKGRGEEEKIQIHLL